MISNEALLHITFGKSPFFPFVTNEKYRAKITEQEIKIPVTVPDKL